MSEFEVKDLQWVLGGYRVDVRPYAVRIGDIGGQTLDILVDLESKMRQNFCRA